MFWPPEGYNFFNKCFETRCTYLAILEPSQKKFLLQNGSQFQIRVRKGKQLVEFASPLVCGNSPCCWVCKQDCNCNWGLGQKVPIYTLMALQTQNTRKQKSGSMQRVIFMLPSMDAEKRKVNHGNKYFKSMKYKNPPAEDKEEPQESQPLTKELANYPI